MDLLPTSNAKSPHIIGVAPRGRGYGEAHEASAWNRAIEMARGRLHPTYLYDGRRILGLTQGFGPFSPHVRYQRFRHGTPWSEMERAREDMLLMPFTTYDALINAATAGQFGRTYFAKTATTAGSVNCWFDLWPVAGNPAPGAINGTAFIAKQYSDATTGAINHRGNVSTMTKHLLSKWAIVTANTPMLMLYDRVLGYDLCTFNAAANQALTNTLTAQRYNSGAPGLLPCLFSNTVNGATAANLTQFRYTNQAGTTLQTMPTTPTVTFLPSAAAPTATLGAKCIAPSTSGQTITWGFNLPLAAGDSGCSLVNDYTTSAANTGTFSIILMKPLTDLMMPIAAIPFESDCVFQTTELERIYDGACLALLMLTPVATALTLQGGIKFAWNT